MSLGDRGASCVAYFFSSYKADTWRGSESGMTTQTDTYNGTTRHFVQVEASWFAANWNASLTARNAVVLFDSCWSVDGPPDDPGNASKSVVARAGGRVGFGESGVVDGPTVAAHYSALLDNLTGITNDGTRRTVGKAMEGETFLRMVAPTSGHRHYWTTLNPAPSALFPVPPIEYRRGSGAIVFDTYMKDGTSPEFHVDRAAGTAEISPRRWMGNGTGSYGVSFDFRKIGMGDVTMRAYSYMCQNKTFDGEEARCLSGNHVTCRTTITFATDDN